MEEIMHLMCTKRDCNLKFDNEKQLTMHKRKHDMVLALNKSSQCSSDETPTPTRFIRNCEAIGLFQDLQNVNPFDETFRQAAEAVKKGQSLRVPTVSSLEKPAGEDLHTPHIDLKDDTSLSVEKMVNCEFDVVNRSESGASVISNSFLVSTSESALTKERKSSPKSDDDVRFFLRLSNGTLVQIASMPHNFDVPKSSVPNTSLGISSPIVQSSNQMYTSNENSSAAVKQKLKEALLKTPKLKPASNIKHCSSEEPNFNLQPRKEKQPSVMVEERDDDRRRRSLERNRIAAMKCREKRKKWVTDLREKYEKMCLTNQALVKEVSFLRKEVARLKGLLISSSQHQLQDLSPTAATLNLISPSSSPKEPSQNHDIDTVESHSLLRGPREGLRLDIEGASRVAVMDLDSPLVRRDEILSSVAPPTTPNERLISFTELDRDTEVGVSEERVTTTVIQVNPNALAKNSLVFS